LGFASRREAVIFRAPRGVIFARSASYIPHFVRSYIAVKKAALFYTAVKRDKKKRRHTVWRTALLPPARLARLMNTED